MGMSMAYQLQPQQQQHTQTQNQEPQVDWENQFKEIEELTNKAEEVEEIQREQSPEIVVDDKYQATFQEVWDSLNSESFENDFINQQYEDFKRTQKMGFQLI